ncbi:DUF4998 domain-containing protein [Butyricimonas paravirosa]
MKMNIYIGILLGILVCVSACQDESLEDTYKDYSGNGEIRYIGKCTDLLVLPGWKRLIVTWENNIDPIIKKVKVRWAQDGIRDSVLLERGTKEYSIESINGKELGNGNYEVSVCEVDADGNSSIENTVFARPYTYEHEEVLGFNHLIAKSYVVKNRLVLYFLQWQDNIKKASLSYTKKDGSQGNLELTKQLVNTLYYLLPDEIDPSKAIILNRKGKLPGCQDVIEFEPYEYSSVKIYEADFKQEMKRQYGFDEEIPSEWADNVETLYLDWTIRSFDDILNLPNLKKLVLGSRRYLLPSSVTDRTYGQSSVSEWKASEFALKVLHELNGLTVERYNNHFSFVKENFIEEMGNTNVEPNVTFFDLTGLKFTLYPEDPEEFPSGLENLTDGDYTTNWDPMYLDLFSSYEFNIDLKELKKLNGLRLVQKQFTRVGENSVAPSMIIIRVSKDNVHWENATYVEENPLGRSNGEINYIPFSDNVKASEYRHVQLKINAGSYQKFYYSGIAEISLY